jgi:hypothetical protein
MNRVQSIYEKRRHMQKRTCSLLPEPYHHRTMDGDLLIPVMEGVLVEGLEEATRSILEMEGQFSFFDPAI